MSRTTPATSLATDQTFSEDSILTLAQAAGLTLDPARAALLLPILRLWLTDSAALNSVMQSEAYREVLPITLFKHARGDAGAA